MKTLIASAAFLTAGTLLSSAATAVVHMSFSDSAVVNYDDVSSSAVGTVGSSMGGYTADYNYAGADSGALKGVSSSGVGTENSLTVTDAISWSLSWTVSFAVQLTSSTSTGWTNIFAVGMGTSSGSSATDNGLRLQVNSSGETPGVWMGGGGATGASTSNTLSTSSFTLLTMVYDCSAQYVYLYWNGTLALSADVSSLEKTSWSTSVHLGSVESNYGNAADNMVYDEFVVYDDALTADEISTYLVGQVAPLTIAIPEPSAFGLLAGTLALAFAASRRRRRAA